MSGAPGLSSARPRGASRARREPPRPPPESRTRLRRAPGWGHLRRTSPRSRLSLQVQCSRSFSSSFHSEHSPTTIARPARQSKATGAAGVYRKIAARVTVMAWSFLSESHGVQAVHPTNTHATTNSASVALGQGQTDVRAHHGCGPPSRVADEEPCLRFARLADRGLCVGV